MSFNQPFAPPQDFLLSGFQNPLLDPSEQKYFDQFLDGLIDIDTLPIQSPVENTPAIEPVEQQFKVDQDRREYFMSEHLRQKELLQPAKRPLEDKSNVVSKKRGPGRPRKNNVVPHSPNSLEDEKKSHRELLTEDQKRLNHVESEKRRRKLIQEGFERLTDLIPALSSQSGGSSSNHSKSIILEKAAEHILLLNSRIQQLEQMVQQSFPVERHSAHFDFQ
ncbi:hypothetical protein EDD86DRAFT_2934 [Gorgonomyces haynaldii]|nr:hypothetical protein EDD86DRAFT_2934 [Gorgonomyces haynaldii]